jgi:drug/metabolite transporter (DMT)-like permease
MPAGRVGAGILVMLAGMLMFSLNDVLGKWLVSSYSAAQVMLVRSLSALVVLLPFLLASNPAQVIRVERPGLQALRSGLLAVEGIGFYFAVKYLPLADVVTYWLAAPVYVAALSPLLLGERVGGRAWIAVLIGFAGVLVALQPSAESLTPEALIALAGSAAYAFAMILGRKLRGTPDRVLVFWQIIGAALVSLPGVLFLEGGWTPPGARDLAFLAALGIVAMLAHMLVNRSFKLAPAAVVMPFMYSMLVWAVIFGALVFDDQPQPAMLAGAVLIVAAGLMLARRPAEPG